MGRDAVWVKEGRDRDSGALVAKWLPAVLPREWLMNADPETLLVALDVGGTWTRALVADARERVVGRGRQPGANLWRTAEEAAVQHVRAALHEALPNSFGEVAVACVGLAGVSHPRAAAMLREAFGTWDPPRIRLLLDDGVPALVAALGDGPGLVVSSGTGSGVIGRGPGGLHRAGGLGPILGDQGSGSALGREVLRAAARALEQTGPATGLVEVVLQRTGARDVRELLACVQGGEPDPAALLQDLDRVAREGDGVAVSLLQSAAGELGALARRVVGLASLPEDAVVATAGGTFTACPAYRGILLECLPGLGTGPHVEEPVVGAMKLALRHLAVDPRTVPPGW